MQRSDDGSDLVRHLERVSGLPAHALERLIAEVTAYFSESVDDFVARRHRELQARDVKNEAIFEQIERELRDRRFAAPPLSKRQIRRLIYG